MSQLPTNVLRTLTRPHSVLDEQVTFHVLPFPTYGETVVLRELAAISPRVEYINERTGERRSTEPEEYREAKRAALAIRSKDPITDWVERDLWSMAEHSFMLFEARCIDITFALTDTSPLALVALKTYWEARDKLTLAERWGLFQHIIARELLALFSQALDATKDSSLLAPKAPPKDDTSPEAPSGGASTTDTSATSSSTSPA